MITYQKAFGGLFLLGKLDGSPAARAILPATLSTAVAIVLQKLPSFAPRALMLHPYPFQIFCFVVGFLLVFRTQAAYNRYYLALQQLTLMTSKWADVALQTCSFDTMMLTEDEEERRRFRTEVTHLVSLLHAVSLQKMRGDSELGNLHPYVVDDLTACAGFQEPSSPGPLLRVVGAPLIGDHGYTRDTVQDHGVIEIEQTPSSSSSSSSSGGGGRGGGNGGARRSRPGESRYNKRSRLGFYSCLLRAGRSCRKCLLPVRQDALARHAALPLHVLGGVPAEEARRLGSVDDRCYLVMQWLVDVVVLQAKAKWFEVEGPVVSRIYQELSDGMLGYNHARKFTEVPFPFPYAQLVLALLVIFALTAPVVIVAWVEDAAAGVLLTFVAVWGYFAIHEVNRELEDPFLHGPNDLPLPTLQADLNNRLQSLDASKRCNRLTALKGSLIDSVQRSVARRQQQQQASLHDIFGARDASSGTAGDSNQQENHGSPQSPNQDETPPLPPGEHMV